MTKEQKQKLELILSKVGDLNFRRRIVTLLDYLDIKDGEKILDAGCGEGFYTMIFHELWPNCQIYPFDYDKKIMSMAQRWFSKKEKNIFWQIGDLTKTPYKTNFFDKIICTEVLEHIPDDKKATAELYRVLKPKGRLAITVPNHNYPFVWDPFNWVRERLGLGHFNASNCFWGGIWALDHLRLYYPNEAKKLVEDAGFKAAKMDGLTHHGVPFNHMVLYTGKQFYTRLPVPQSVKKSMEKFEWKENSSPENRHSSFTLNPLKWALSFFKWVDSYNDNFNSLEKSSMAVAVLAIKNDKK